MALVFYEVSYFASFAKFGLHLFVYFKVAFRRDLYL